jgi:hypothetical protein
LELSESKTVITHATSQAARFLGYEICTHHADMKITNGRRSANAKIGLFVPRDVIRNKCGNYLRKGVPAQRGALLHDQDFTIVAKYAAEYRGLVQYYLLAQDVGARAVFSKAASFPKTAFPAAFRQLHERALYQTGIGDHKGVEIT